MRILPKTIEYRQYKTFRKSKLLHDLEQELLKGGIYQINEEMYSTSQESFKTF